MAFHFPMMPGMEVEKEDDSDSDHEAVEERQQNKARQKELRAKQEAKMKERADKLAAKVAAEASVEKLLMTLAPPSDCQEGRRTAELCVDRPPDDDFDARLTRALEFRDSAKKLFHDGDMEEAIANWMGCVYHLDWTKKQLAERSDDERLRACEVAAPVLSNLCMAHRKKGRLQQARAAADFGIDFARGLPYEASKPIRVKLLFRRAVVLGDARKFEAAREDLVHLLQLAPDDEEAKTAMRNCDTALRREKGPKDKRWRGPLTRPIPKKTKQFFDAYWKVVAALLGPLLAVLLMVLRR
eukprot:TRINITY_DN5757_c0_g1_i1.p1 TRINITY_DN5757_c0_g1~~TRINITY_DN5757_c0_g1_i1.p1  ORF type:complete len:321 (-),score=82.96 TRINITY_DN5757_c0_g1_i1:130-1023(-)